MKKNPLHLVLWTLSLLLLLPTEGWSLNETTNAFSEKDYKCTMKITAAPIGVYCGETTGSIEINITGGAAPYKIEWDNNSSSIWAEKTTNQNSYSIPDLPKGMYQIKVRDANGCRDMVTVMMDDNASDLVYTLEAGNPCSVSGSLTIRISNSSPPYWVILEGPTSGAVIVNSNAFRLDDLLPGDYKVIVDKDGCAHEKTISVISTPTPLSLSISQEDGNVCDAFGDIMLNISGGTAEYYISWYGATNGNTRSNGSKPIQNLASGDYTFTVRDANGCTTSANVTIKANGTDLACVLTQIPVICDNMGQIGVAIHGGLPSYRVDYSGPVSGSIIATNTDSKSATATILNLPSGTYTINVVDSRGCAATENITVGGTDTDLACILTQTPVHCDDMGQIGVAISGGEPAYRVDYTGPVSGFIVATTTAAQAATASILNLPAGYYTITVTDSRGCSASESITVGSGGTNMTSELTVNSLICSRASGITLDIRGGKPVYTVSYTGTESGTFTVSGGSLVDIPLPIGRYTVVVTDANGCSTAETVDVVEGVNSLHCRLVKTHAICTKNGLIEVIISGGKPGFTVSWKAGSTIQGTATTMGYSYIIEAPSTGTYDITVIDANGCVVMESTTILQLENNLAYTLIATSGVQEGNGSIELYFQNGRIPYTVNLTGPTQIVTITSGPLVLSNLGSGYYSVNITDANGCQLQQYITVPSLSTPTPPVPDGMKVITTTPNAFSSNVEKEAIGTKEVSESALFLSNRQKNKAFEVYQNYPNPFTSFTTIGFNLPKSMKVKITIHNHLGKTIAVREKEYMKGYNEYLFNRSDLGSGVLYYTIKAGEFIKTTRMLYIE